MSTVSNNTKNILGLFPSFDVIGGVQTSGRIAWEGIVETMRSRSNLQKAYFFCYGKEKEQTEFDTGFQSTWASTKHKAIFAALRRRWPAQTVLIWHIHLLKLLPFFRLRNAKVILFLHGIEAWKPFAWPMTSLLKRVNLFLSNSDYTWQQFIQLNPSFSQASHETVHLGCGTSSDSEILKPEKPPVVLMLSRLTKSENYKGHQEIIGSWPHVLQQIPDAELWIAGDGDLREELERLVEEYRLEDKVRFLGWVSESKKNELLARCCCLAMPSRREGFGLVYLEAMRLGRPCLVSTLDAGREVIHPPEAGVAVDPTKIHDLADKICFLLSDADLSWFMMSKNAQTRYHSHFTAAHFQKRLLKSLEMNGEK